MISFGTKAFLVDSGTGRNAFLFKRNICRCNFCSIIYYVAEQVLDMNTAIRNERFNEGIFVSEILFFYSIYALLVLP